MMEFIKVENETYDRTKCTYKSDKTHKEEVVIFDPDPSKSYTGWDESYKHPISFDSSDKDNIDDELFSDLPEEIQSVFRLWVRMRIVDRKSTNPNQTSYGLKHIFEEDFGVYMTNNQFKDAMLACGYFPENFNDLNWRYSIKTIESQGPAPEPCRYLHKHLTEIITKHHANKHNLDKE